MQDPVVEQLDLESLVRGGPIKGAAVTAARSGGMPRSTPVPLPGVAATATASSSSLGMFEDDAIVEDTSSWSSEDEVDVEDDKESSEEAKKAEAQPPPPPQGAEATPLQDPLGLLGELKLNDPRFDIASVKFDAVALLSSVHDATPYDKLRSALDTLKADQAPPEKQRGLILGLGMIEGNNFDRFVATSNTVVTLREGVLKAGLGGGQWMQAMDYGLEQTAEEIERVMRDVFTRREQIRNQARVARFVGRYRAVLKLPETLRGLISSPSGYGQAAREYRKAQRVLRGAAGPVFRQVLKELEDVASKWKAALYQRLATEFVGSAGAAEHVVEATRALRELGSSPEPGMYFSQQQMHFAQHRTSGGAASVAETAKILPALRLAYGKLGAGTADGSLQAGVWGVCMDLCIEALKSAVSESAMATVLGEAQQLWERIGEAVQGAVGGRERQPCYTAWGGMVQWLRQRVARRISLDGMRECGSRPGAVETSVRTMQLLAPVVGDMAALDVGLKCLCKGVDLILQRCDAALQSPMAASWQAALAPERGSPEEVLMDCVLNVRRVQSDGSAAVWARAAGGEQANTRSRSSGVGSAERLSASPAFAKSSAQFVALCAAADERALRGYVTRAAFFVRRVVATGMEEEAEEEFQLRLDGKGALEETVYAPAGAALSSAAAPTAQVERSALSDWAQEAVHLLVVIRSHVSSRLPDDTMAVVEALADMVFCVAEEMIEREREVLGRNLSVRWSVSLRFLGDVFSFSRRVVLHAGHLITKLLRAKVPPSLERAAALRRCFVLEDAPTSKNSARVASPVNTSASLAKLTGAPAPVAVPEARKVGGEEAPLRGGLEDVQVGRQALVTPQASRPSSSPSPRDEQVLYSPRQARGPSTVTPAAAALAASTSDKNPFGSLPTAVLPAKKQTAEDNVRAALTGSGSRSLGAIERKREDSIPTPKMSQKPSAKAVDSSNPFAAPKSTNPFG